jgi:chaperone BCS1
MILLTDFRHQKQPAWGRSREFEITTRSKNGRWSQPTTGDLEEEEEDDDELVHGRRKRKVAFMPSLCVTLPFRVGSLTGVCYKVTRHTLFSSADIV